MSAILFLLLLPPLCLGFDYQMQNDKALRHQGEVSADQEVSISIKVTSKRPLRVTAEADISDPHTPVLFSLRREDSQHSWKIPMQTQRPSSSHTKVLSESSSEEDTMRLTVSSRSRVAKNFSVILELVHPQDFDLAPGANRSQEAVISPTKMALFQFTFPKYTPEDTFLLVVTNLSTQVCSVLSVQPRGPGYPEVHDDERQMMSGLNGTQYQTFLGTAALVLQKSRFHDGVHVVLLVMEEDESCYLKTRPELNVPGREMRVNVAIEKLTASREMATGLVLAFYLLIGLVVGGIGCLLSWASLFEFDGKFSKLQYVSLQRAERERRRMSQQNQGVALRVVGAIARMKNRSKARPYATDEADAQEVPLEATVRPFVDLRSPRREVAARPPGTDQETVPPPAENQTFASLAVAEDLGEDSGCSSGCCSLGDTTVVIEGSPDKFSQKKPRQFFWQQSVEEDDATDGCQGSKCITLNHVRSRHASEATLEEIPYLKKIVTLNKDTVKQQRQSSNVTLADMAIHNNPEYFPNFMWLRSEQFVWNLFMVGIYYTLPVFQLVFYYQNMSLSNGDMDTCYYNFLCLYPWGPIADFGHVFSNIGYIICGLFFIFIVKNRSRKYYNFCSKINEATAKGQHPRFTGIPESYGIFYALGGALVLEGVLSGCYHICPTATNFQFDTTFMYAITVLLFLKVYQYRHPDITTTGHFVFMWIGFALFFEMLGYFTEHILFWIIFIFIYVIFVVVFVVNVYYHATGPNIFQRFKNAFNIIRSKDTSKLSFNGKVLSRLIPTIIIVLINIALAGFIAMKRKAGVSRYLLVILMVNLVLYITYYIGHKLYHRLRPQEWKQSEGFRPITVIYIVLSMVFMLGACYFFAKELKSSSGTAAESRNLNDVCFMMIFDNHDIWHFLSAAGLFFMFMFILTIEDYNKAKPRHLIPVF